MNSDEIKKLDIDYQLKEEELTKENFFLNKYSNIETLDDMKDISEFNDKENYYDR